jgi:TolB protein
VARLLLSTLAAALAGLALPGAAWSTFPGANGKIAFLGVPGNIDQVFTMNPDGSGQTPLGLFADDPAWSPDGKKIAYANIPPGLSTAQIFVMNSDGSDRTQLTNDPVENRRDPAWSPDGKKIVFFAQHSGFTGNEIGVMNADGTGLTVVAPGLNNDPAWSPDGTKIAFDHFSNGHSEIYVMNPDGSAQSRLTNTPQPSTTQSSVARTDSERPDWSPDGKKIAFDRVTGFAPTPPSPGDGIYIMNSDGSGQTRLTNPVPFPKVQDTGPVWSPNGALIAFSRATNNGPSNTNSGVVSTVNEMSAVDGSGMKVLTSASGLNFGPDWQPLPFLTLTPVVTTSTLFTTINVQLLASTSVGILVQRRVHGRLVTVGRVPFGRKHKGRNRIRWDCRVNGRRLRPGIYFIRVRLLDSHGHVFEVSKQFRIRVPAPPHVR